MNLLSAYPWLPVVIVVLLVAAVARAVRRALATVVVTAILLGVASAALHWPPSGFGPVCLALRDLVVLILSR